MSGHSSGDWLLLFVTALIVAFQVIAFKRPMFWDTPLKHGRGFFLGVAVPAGFYEGEGVRRLRRYRSVMLAAHLIAAIALLVVLAWGRWDLLPVWAGGSVVLVMAAFFGFMFYTRRTLGANPPGRASVAIPLETRSFGDYISWRVEALIGVITASSWALLLIHGHAQLRWEVPVVMTYVIIGLFPFKIGIVRGGIPVPAERPEEHLRFIEVARRYSLSLMDCVRWLFVAILGGWALLQGWRLVGRSTWLHWFVIGATLVLWLYMVVVIIRGGQRMDAIGCDLVPPGSWSTPFRPARQMATGFAVGFGAWFAGLVLLLVFFHR